MPEDSVDGKWWLKLPDNLKIFACIPFILPKGGAIKAVAVARVEPEDTGNDLSYLSIETEADVSQSRVKATLDKHKLDMRWLAVESFPSGNRVHLTEIKGFVTGQHEALQELGRALDKSLVALNWLGAYALPITL